jgi:hypothetical protein
MSGLRRDICHRERPAASGFGCLRACVRRWLEHALDQGGVAVLHSLDELPVPDPEEVAVGLFVGIVTTPAAKGAQLNGRPKRWTAASTVGADRQLGRDAGVPAVRLGTTGSVASAPRTALREAAVVSMSAIGFMEPSVALVFINLNHEFDASIN